MVGKDEFRTDPCLARTVAIGGDARVSVPMLKLITCLTREDIT